MATPRELWRPAYVGIGSNLDEPVEKVSDAIAALGRLPDSGWCAHSSLWRSAPMGPAGQPDYINAAAVVLTRLDPRSLLRRLQNLEKAAGRRRRAEQWGPRPLDLDLLVQGSLTIDEEGLKLPHPRIAERNFVLLPLAEIAPHLYVPGRGTVARLLSRISSTNPRIDRI